MKISKLIIVMLAALLFMGVSSARAQTGWEVVKNISNRWCGRVGLFHRRLRDASPIRPEHKTEHYEGNRAQYSRRSFK
jgi:hypothetical protein